MIAQNSTNHVVGVGEDMTVLSFDLGKKTGWSLMLRMDGVISVEDYGLYSLPNEFGLGTKAMLNRGELGYAMTQVVDRLIKIYGPVIDCVAREFAINQRGKAQEIWNTLDSALCFYCYSNGIKLARVSPKEMKFQLTGSGVADKVEVVKHVRQRYGIKEFSSRHAKDYFDQADAVGVGHTAFALNDQRRLMTDLPIPI